jgi:hypothetical protein
VYTCHPDHSKIFGDHHGGILVQNGALVHFEYGFPLAYLTTILSNQFSKNLWVNSKLVEIWKKMPT